MFQSNHSIIFGLLSILFILPTYSKDNKTPQLQEQVNAEHNERQRRGIFDNFKKQLKGDPETEKDDALIDSVAKVKETPDPEIQRILPTIGQYLRIHKFYDFDHRDKTFQDHRDYLEGKSKVPTRNYQYQFPTKPLSDFDHNFGDACKISLQECFKAIQEKYPKGENKKDIGLVMHYWPTYTYPLDERIVRNDPQENEQYYQWPFKSNLEQFNFRTSASYFLCWYTLQQDISLKYFGEDCPIDKWNPDYREDDKIPWGCAFLSFCPDPCCGKVTDHGNLPVEKTCYKDSNNPCHGIGSGKCGLDNAKNLNLNDLILNKFNLSCPCNEEKPGFVYNTQMKICVDLDECEENIARCPDGELCRNTIGSYACVCPMGYIREYDAFGAEKGCIKTSGSNAEMQKELDKEASAATNYWAGYGGAPQSMDTPQQDLGVWDNDAVAIFRDNGGSAVQIATSVIGLVVVLGYFLRNY